MRRHSMRPTGKSIYTGVLAAALSMAAACETSEPETPQQGQPLPGIGADSGTIAIDPSLADASVSGDASVSSPEGEGGCQTFDSAFAAIQKLVFERHGC